MFRAKSLAGRIMIIVFICMMMLMIGIASGLHYMVVRYSDSVSDQADIVLHGIAAQVENALADVSLQVRLLCADEKLQDDISIWQQQNDAAVHMMAEHSIVSFLLNGVKQNISGVHFCASENRTLTAGTTRLSGNQLRNAAMTAEQKGGEVWARIDGVEGMLYMAVPVHSVRVHDYYNTMGFLVAEVNFSRLLRNLLGPNWEKDNTYQICIFCDDQLLFPQRGNRMDNALWQTSKKNITGITWINGECRYQLTDEFQINHTNWLISADMPYEKLSELVHHTYGVLMVIVLVIIISTSVIVWQYTHKITKQYNDLVRKMKLFEEGRYQPPETIPEAAGDELDELNRCFDLMAVQYDHMVKENYIKQLAITEARLQALEQQINPHFIFNTLEIINYYAKTGDNPGIHTVVLALADLLRNSLDQRENVISLAREMDFVKKYMDIQTRRFADVLSYRMIVSPEVLDVRIPKLTIMPLVDNAIRYTLEEEEQCYIKISAGKVDDMLYVGVTDNGPKLDENIMEKLRGKEVLPKGNGIGLLNIDHRIKLIFGENYGLRIENGMNEMTVSFLIPYKKDSNQANEGGNS